MAKNNLGTIVLIGGIAILGYFLWKQLGGSGFSFSGGTGGGGTETGNDGPVGPAPMTPQQKQTDAGSRQAWTGPTVQYGQPGQPSVAFAIKTVQQGAPYVYGVGKATNAVVARNEKGTTVVIAKPLALIKRAPLVTIIKPSIAQSQASFAFQAMKANAPPRVVAKIKAGKWY
jgi:hypothetical protein